MTEQQGGGEVPSPNQQTGESTPPKQQQAEDTTLKPKDKPIFRDWAAF